MEEVDKGCPIIRMGMNGECIFWYRPTGVVPDQRPLNGCVCVHACVFGPCISMQSITCSLL